MAPRCQILTHLDLTKRAATIDAAIETHSTSLSVADALDAKLICVICRPFRERMHPACRRSHTIAALAGVFFHLVPIGVEVPVPRGRAQSPITPRFQGGGKPLVAPRLDASAAEYAPAVPALEAFVGAESAEVVHLVAARIELSVEADEHCLGQLEPLGDAPARVLTQGGQAALRSALSHIDCVSSIALLNVYHSTGPGFFHERAVERIVRGKVDGLTVEFRRPIAPSVEGEIARIAQSAVPQHPLVQMNCLR